MAAMKAALKIKVGGSTILEVVVSMVLIMAIFGIAMMIVVNVTNMSLSFKKLKAESLLQQTALKNSDIETGTKTMYVAGTRIEQDITPYADNAALRQLHLSAYDGNQKIIAELTQIIIADDE